MIKYIVVSIFFLKKKLDFKAKHLFVQRKEKK